MKLVSPLRYPGGKTILARFLEDVIDLNDLRGGAYCEPFAGGAGAALALLEKGVVSNLILNDADKRVYEFWHSAITDPDRFCKRINDVPLTIDEWRHQHQICTNPDSYDEFDVGFAAFFMNRCNRSGVLSGAGPIGGYSQEGRWRINVRFNRDGLVERISALKKFKEKIRFSNLDAIAFLKQALPNGNKRKSTFIYLDPPYVVKGQRLYLNAYEERDHAMLARYMMSQKRLPWVMSYDDNATVRRLYSDCRQALLPTRYSLQEKRSENELAIAPNRIALPKMFRYGRDGEVPLVAIA